MNYFKKKVYPYIFHSLLVIPMNMNESWVIDKYKGIPANQVIINNNQIKIKVNKSAGPIFYKFDNEVELTSLSISGKFNGLPQILVPSKQGEKGFDDYALRIGLVISGDKKLSFFEKMIAASWVKNLYALFPNSRGIDYVHFYNFTQNKKQLGRSRVHPVSKLIRESFIFLVEEDGEFEYSHQLEKPQKVLGLWISSDGDDTKSQYDVVINRLEFNKL